jgi:glycosyltransferase involved in cell wall biosynthesis
MFSIPDHNHQKFTCKVFAVADWMIHLAWADHCPNVVVEALSQGTPIICGEVGGTKEMIAHGAYGVVLKDDSIRFRTSRLRQPSKNRCHSGHVFAVAPRTRLRSNTND